MKIITNSKTSRRCKRIFRDRMLKECSVRILCTVTDRSSRNPQPKYVYYSPALKIWYNCDWDGINEFGIGKPEENGHAFPVAYFNVAKNTAVFGEDEGNLYILHSGRIGGGKPGIGKNLLLKNYSRPNAILNFKNNYQTKQYILIADLDSKNLPKKVAEFIYEVYRIKDDFAKGRLGNLNDRTQLKKYTDEFPEGRKFEQLHKSRERNSRVVLIAKQQFIEKHGRLFCEVCNFNFEETYGPIGKYFIEGHHTIAVSNMKSDHKTKPEDIAMVCSNCHRMVHKRRPWLTMKDLKNLLEEKK